MNKSSLFQPISPLTVWFWFVQLLMVVGIVDYWLEMFSHHSPWLIEKVPLAAGGTALFVIASLLIFRHRLIGALLWIIGWIFCALLRVPTL